MKYWVALENIFTSKKDEKITETLCKGISVVLAFGNYRFIEANTIQETYRRVSNLYKLRSKIVHRGCYQEISNLELIDMCKLSWQITLSFFDFRSMGYTDVSQIEEQSNRLYEQTR